MFEGLFAALRAEGVPVAMDEWLALQGALERGLAGSSLSGLYLLGRAVLVKRERHLDAYDAAFSRYFSGLEPTDPEIAAHIWDWLAARPEALRLTPEQRARLDAILERLDPEEVRQRLEERLREQREAHHGGREHVGTGGTSPFGHSGYRPGGVRIGGEGGWRSAVAVAGERRFRHLRADASLGVRDFGVALRGLRRLSTRVEGPVDELDLESTIDETAGQAGALRLVFRRPRRNAVRVALLLDVGGSMDEHAALCDRLFSAVHQAAHFRELSVRYFHNCVYDRLYRSPLLLPRSAEPTVDVLARAGPDHRLIVVGDACMAPGELAEVGGAIDYQQRNDETGWVWLSRLADRFAHAAWLNPVPEAWWETVYGAPTLGAVRRLFPMYELTVEGLERAVRGLMVR